MTFLKNLIKKHFSTFVYFYRYLRYRIFIAVALSIMVGVLDGLGLTMFLPLLQMVGESAEVDPQTMGNLSFLIDWIQASGLSLTLGVILTVMLIFFVLKGVFNFGAAAYQVVLLQYFVRTLRLDVLSALNKIQFKAFVTADAGRIQNTMSGEVDRVAQGYNFYFQAFQQMILVTVYMGFAFFVNAQFAILVSIGGGLTNFLYKVIYKKTVGASKKLTKDANLYQGQIIQHVGNFKYLKATGLAGFFGDRLRNTIFLIEESRRKIGMFAAILQSAREPLLIGIVVLVILIQINVLGGTLGGILISLLFFYRALSALTMMQNSWNRYLEVSGSMANMQEFQQQLHSNRSREGKVEFDQLKDKLVLQHASFSYSATTILSDINLTIQKNETVAFVGESGSGKTTLVNILAGLMPLDQGSLHIDGISATDLKSSSYQQRIGYITQEPVIFNDTIFHNVTLWAEKTPDNIQRFQTAIRKAAIDDFISTLPKQEQTQLGNNGINLSGGQKQRISIARELYKDIDILIMDEATSALDSETERMIQYNIDALKGAYTILVVAHRLSTIRNADRIVFLKQGRLEAIGKYQDLIEREGAFRRMAELQEI